MIRKIIRNPVNLFQLSAALMALIALITLYAVSVNTAQAEDPPGFDSGERAFTNPFAAPPPEFPNDAPDYDAEVDYGDAQVNNPPPVRESNTRSNSNPQVNFNSNPAPSKTKAGIQVGGGLPNSVNSDESDSSTLEIDSESALGKGSKEIITDFNFPDADILDIAKTLGKLTGKNFILDKDVKGKITIVSNSAITVGDAWKAFLTALDMNQFTLIPSGTFIRIARQRDARDKQLRTYVDQTSPDTDALITRVFPLKYISAEEVARTFRSFMPANSRIIPYAQTNTVIVTDTGSNIAKLQKMLEFLDVEGFDAGIEVIPVKYASAVELSKLVDTLIPDATQSKGRGVRIPRGGAFEARRTKEGGIINTIIADERTNTLIVHANPKGADEVRALVTRLDKKIPAQIGGGKIHVVYLQFADSEEIAKTLNALSSENKSSKPAPSSPNSVGIGVNPAETVLFEGAIKVSPDKATNSLVITASPSDFVTVQRVINKLDIPRDEVYVEVVILEMSLGRNFEFSTNIALPTSGLGSLPKGEDLLGALTSPFAQKGLVLGFKQGEKSSMTIGGQTVTVSSVMGLIKAIQTNSRANVLATPQILTLDNTEATFETAEKIPVPTQSVSQGTVTNSITKESVSLSITIKPQINKISNFVKLDIKAKLADISDRQLPAQVAQQAFATFERNATTSVVVADSDTVVLGGLVRDKQTETVSKIPILGDIPLLGWLFKAKTSATEKTNLLIFITPHIVRQYEKVRAILDRKLKERDDYLEQNAGGEDPMRPYRDQIIRSLPDMEKITSFKPKQSVTINNEEDELDQIQENMNPNNWRPGQTSSEESKLPPPLLKPEQTPMDFEESNLPPPTTLNVVPIDSPAPTNIQEPMVPEGESN